MRVSIFSIRPRKDQRGVRPHRIGYLHFDNYQDIFDRAKLRAKLKGMSPGNQFNLFYTSAYLEGPKTIDKEVRLGDKQNLLAFDIDGVEDEDTAHIVGETVAEATGLDYEKSAVVWSGNGVQFIAQLKDSFVPKSLFFNRHREHYIRLCEKIKIALQEEGIRFGKVDQSIFSPSRLLRLPETTNAKPLDDPHGPNSKRRSAYIIKEGLEEQAFELEENNFIAPATEEVEGEQEGRGVDEETILKECGFIQKCVTEPEGVHEPDAYALFSLLGRIPGKKDFLRDLTKRFTNSKTMQTANFDDKLKQALEASGPRTCSYISSTNLYSDCENCKHWEKVKTPLQIKSKGFIATRAMGFTTMIYSKKGAVKGIVRHYNDLQQALMNDLGYMYFSLEEMVKSYKDTHYITLGKGELRKYLQSYVEDNGGPTLTMREMSEAMHRVLTRAPVMDKLRGVFNLDKYKLNFANGVYDRKVKKMMEHDKKFAFDYCLPKNYTLEDQPTPVFDRFIDNITLGREGLKEVLISYIGYIVSGDDYKFQVVLVLQGEGNNGKSTYIDLIRKLVGEEMCCSVDAESVQKDMFALGDLEGNLVNIVDDEGPFAFFKSNVVKKCTGNSLIRIRKHQLGGYTINPKAKWVISFNELPNLKDLSKGMLRRLLVVPLDYDIDKDKKTKKDIYLVDKMLQEAPGIYKKCLDAYERVEENNGFVKTVEMQDAMVDLVYNANPFEEWFHYNVEIRDDKRGIYSNELFDNFRKMFQSDKMTIRTFNKLLKAKLKSLDLVMERVTHTPHRKFWCEGILLKNIIQFPKEVQG